mmetsp:Transcript_10369/g.19874  ORF Transcript_10369/g.19874 Transcript_10369/m.19874 type:complete len:188 (-) Transcript_10369:376-939(-)|eukprot:CAMPEP_0170167662 /NCGR_PEP_ID=MMETSP0040_2-20121228/1001_1 /TAXON_ID=641309 /ORGANISM="Lotharella oceanica, Strain CCMP622" /LENGTH=187 /DNA_ID=CAMNT_0010405755 /DNA_START=43 /DNA_END=606 /DNA_ORIENTATION=-
MEESKHSKKEAKDQKQEAKGLDDEVEDEKLILKSQDKGCKGYPVAKKTAIMSTLVKTVVEGDKESMEIPLPNVKGTILRKVITYMEYHTDNPPKEIEKPLKSPNMADVVSEWDAHFVEVPQDVLFELILAANYMDIKPLLDLTCAKVASMIKGKTPEQIRKLFHIQNDFSPQEEEAVRAENKWAEEA